MPAVITVRTAVAADAGAIAALEHHFVTAPRDIERYFGSLHPSDHEETTILVAEAAEEPTDGAAKTLLGKVEVVRGHSTASHHIGYVLRVVVHPSARRQGIARQLMEHAVQHAKSVGITELDLHVVATNEAARNLYEDLGFREVEREIYYRLSLGTHEDVSPAAAEGPETKGPR